MTHPVRSILTGAAATVGIALIVVGFPLLLSAVGHPPELGGWSVQAAVDALTRPDDGTLFLTALTVAAWASWAVFTALIALEAVAQVRRRPVLRVPGLGWAQALAAGLVSTAVVGLSGQSAIAATPDVVPVQTVQAPTGEAAVSETVPDAEAAGLSEQGAQDPVGRYVVRDGDTYWSIAESELGAGQRYTDIVELNAGRTMGDGVVLTGDEFPTPGWELVLPVGASRDAPVLEESAEGTVHTVQAGETLSHIALEHLGDANAYPEVFDANEGRPQAVGGSLTDPDLIHPGWNLAIPTAGQAAESPAEDSHGAEDTEPDRRTEAEEPSSAQETPAGGEGAEEETGSTEEDSDPQPVDESPAPSPASAAPVWEAPQAEAATDDIVIDATLAADDADTPVSLAPIAGISALAAAGLAGVLLRRRRVQQRDRRPGHRIVQSTDPDIVQAEEDLHTAADPASVELLDRALRSLSAKCASTRTPLPHILGARLDSECELLVSEGQGIPVTPFRRVDDRTWRVETASAALLDEETARQIPAPYPGLATIGHDSSGTQILLDLPQAGAIGLTGEDTAVTEVLTSLAVELSTSPAADHAMVTCIGQDVAPGLAQMVKTQRVRAFHSMDECLKELELQTLEYASTGPSEDTAPEVVLSDQPLSRQHLDRLSRILGSSAAPPIALIARETAADRLPGPWHLHADGEQALTVLGGTAVTLQRVSRAAYAEISTLLRTAEVSASVPAPGWEQVPQEQHLVASTAVTPQSQAASLDALIGLSTPAAAAPSFTDPTYRPAPLHEYEVQLRVLGKVEITGPDTSTVEPGRQRSLTELACYLMLRPDRTPDQISRSMGGPRGPWTASTRSGHLSRLRAWLGRDSTGSPHFPTQKNGTYALAPSVGCDWDLFQKLAGLGLAEDSQRATTLLEEALELVRGEPFTGVGLDRYGWAEPLKPEMNAAMVDVAHTIAARHLRDGFLEAARTALLKALEVDPACELLYRDLFRVEYKAGHPEAISRALQRLHIALDRLDLEMSEETEKLLHHLHIP
ncbi:BTAD domain-containing putative transcriptional regulator [Nocardiopsis sp. CNT312]|uniref:BTAD domain-containing putative transcriptional regulator n=1 Tax=Nocardiopsis sp. CNT312 TaxID=1137268 RepID=UPI00048D4C31|nr:BTAD domain-containing putative transcriptional regulator [Nocardiopsis sp. CNT312]